MRIQHRLVLLDFNVLGMKCKMWRLRGGEGGRDIQHVTMENSDSHILVKVLGTQKWGVCVQRVAIDEELTFEKIVG